MVPRDVRADSFGDVIGAIRDEDVKGAESPSGQPYRARDFHLAVPVAVRGGYRFALGDPVSDDPKWIRGKDGRPFVLDLDRVPASRARARGTIMGFAFLASEADQAATFGEPGEGAGFFTVLAVIRYRSSRSRLGRPVRRDVMRCRVC